MKDQGFSSLVTKLRYTGTAAIVVRGLGSGQSYVFSQATPERTVDRRDVEGLLRMALFRRVG